MIALARLEPTSRHLKSTASVGAMIVGFLSFTPQSAVAGDLTLNTNFGVGTRVYGNSVAGDPKTIDNAAPTSGNTVTIESGAVALEADGVRTTGYASVTNNRVVMNGGSVQYVAGGSGGSGTSDSNSVEIHGGTVAGAVYGSWSDGGVAKNSTVLISGGQVGSVYGAYSLGAGAVTGNYVTITGGRVTGTYIAGGMSGSGSITDNTVTISGAPTISNSNLALYGGRCVSVCGDGFTGNRLELKVSGLTVGSLANFQYLDFYLPTTLTAGTTMLTVIGTANLTDGHVGSSVINVGINGASSPLVVGDSVTLIRAGTLITAGGLNRTATGTGMQGVTLAYTFGISTMGTDLIAAVSSAPTVTNESKALSEGFVSAAALINQGADLANGKGMANALATAGEGWSTFSAVSGGSQRTQTGSYVDVDGVALLAGFARQFDPAAGDATAGVFA